MAEHDALLRAILEDPEDDTVRLVYADYLQENGNEPRAVYIRESIETPAYDIINLTRKGADPFALLGITGDKYRGWGGEPVRLIGDKYCYRADRGFASGVYCNDIKQLARDCKVCNGQVVDCLACHGTGYIPGPVLRLFNQYPITDIHISNRGAKPIHLSGGMRPYSWHHFSAVYGATTNIGSAWLPWRVFEIMHDQGLWLNHGPGDVLGFDSPEEAREAFVCACVAFGREYAGLSQLKESG